MINRAPINIEIDISDQTIRRYSEENLLVSNDNQVYTFNITLTNANTTVDLTSIDRIIIKFNKPDNTKVEYSSLDGDRLQITDAPNGIITYQLGTQEIAKEGDVVSELSLYGSNGERITSCQFTFKVRQDIDLDGAIESTNEFNTLTTLILDTNELHDQAEVLIPQMEEAVQSTKVTPKTGVLTYTDITTTYPTPEVGWLVHTTDTGKWWRYDGTDWINTATYSNEALDALIADNMILNIDNLQTGKKYKAGIQISADGKPQFIYEEVI